MNQRTAKMSELLRLSHELGNPHRHLSILAEGNTSAKISPDTFLVKASGCNLETLRKEDVVECKSNVLLAIFDRAKLSDEEVEEQLLKSRVDARAKKPSVEALFHAWLLTLPGVEYVGHTHATAVTSILCSPRAREFAVKRIVPDEVVCCDVASVFVPYTDPGVPLARVIRKNTEAHIKKHGRPPRVILLENHGIITLGRTPEAVLAAMLMAEKAAHIWLGASVVGGTRFMTPKDVARIDGRLDEAKRRKTLRL